MLRNNDGKLKSLFSLMKLLCPVRAGNIVWTRKTLQVVITWPGIQLRVFQETFVGIIRCDDVICTAEYTHPMSMTKIVMTLYGTT